MRIIFVNTEIHASGGMIVPFEYIRELRQRGYDAFMWASPPGADKDHREQLMAAYPDVPVKMFGSEETTDDDILIALRWEQCQMLEFFKGRKFQFVQGDDIRLLGDDETRAQCSSWRRNTNWELIGVSPFVLIRWLRGKVVPNPVADRFFLYKGLTRDIDILIEGNYEPNKNIDEAIRVAKQAKVLLEPEKKDVKIVWFGRETHPVEGVECITNPKQDTIPDLYQRSKVFIKLSHSEGFCLPVLEAMASGCLVCTRNMGGNDNFCLEGQNCLMENLPEEIKDHLKDRKHQYIVSRGMATAQNYRIKKSTDLLLKSIL